MKTSRRQFLENALAAPAMAPWVRMGRLGLLLGPILAPAVGAGASPDDQFENPHIIRYDAQCFTLNDRDTFIFSAAFHYPRCPRQLWRDRLEKLKTAGFNTIETYVFWNYHEPVEGKVDLTEFEDFIKLVHEMGFWMIARPGPYVCAEWDAGGFPHWIIARQFPLRSADPRSIQTSQHWFNAVLPVIQRHQITTGGPVILVQIENEYDYWKLPEDQKVAYIHALAQMAWNAGIDVPLITNWVKQARENNDPIMARITDTADFYPRWAVVREVLPGLSKLRKEEPLSPLGITELQGGWFSEFGGKLSVDQPGVDAAQLNLLTKTVIEQGVTYFNYYMGFGGTNFDWAAKTLTTTYDYAAPVREPGGLWPKYYAARAIGASLELFGNVLLRAAPITGVVQSSNPNVSISERASGKSGVIFVRENANASQLFQLHFIDPYSPTHRIISAPRQGQLSLGARQMKMLPVQIPIAGARLRYSTAEVLAHGYNLDRGYLIVYDDPNTLVEISLSTANEPKVEGDTDYQYWDSDYESVTIGFHSTPGIKMLIVNEDLQVICLPRDLALRTWSAEFPAKVIPDTSYGTTDYASEELPKDVVGRPPEPTVRTPLITDCARAIEHGSEAKKDNFWVVQDYAPGEHDLTLLMPYKPQKAFVNDALVGLDYDRHWRTTRLRVSVPALPVQPVTPSQFTSWVEKIDPSLGDWKTTPAIPLEKLGPLPYGYVKYRAQFQYSGTEQMFLSSYTNDKRQVFINGKHVPAFSVPGIATVGSLQGIASPGANTLEILYEAFGSANFGTAIAELKGIQAANIGADNQSAVQIASWQVQAFPAIMRGRELNPDYSGGAWESASIGGAASDTEVRPMFTWVRASFALPATPEGWFIPWKAIVQADRDALLYLNNRFVGRYQTNGPQQEFYLPEPFLNTGGQQANVLTVALAYTANAGHIRSLSVAPCAEFATMRNRVELHWEW
jgi:hypothetical protein